MSTTTTTEPLAKYKYIVELSKILQKFMKLTKRELILGNSLKYNPLETWDPLWSIFT